MTVSQNSLRADLAKWNARLPAKTVHRLDSLTDYLHTHYREKITAKQLESLVGMNFDYLNRTFRRLNGQSIFRYLTEVRINRAKELLATTDMKIWEIAWETGFSDQFYFSRQFKKYTGISPALFAGSRSG